MRFVFQLTIAIAVAVGLHSFPAPSRGHDAEHPLFKAIRQRNTLLTVSLVREGMPVNTVDDAGTTPLLLAARDGDLESMRLLLAHQADPNAANKAGATPLLWAAGDPDKVRLLLEHGADPAARSALGNTPLIAAASYPDSLETIGLLLAAKASVATPNAGDETPLSAAARMGNLESVRLLLAHGADPKAGFKPWSVLHSRSPRVVDIVSLLADGGADLNRADEFAGHALNYALLNEQLDVAELLVERGARLDLPTPEGRVPPMVLAAYNEADDPRMARLLLKHGAPIASKTAAEETALNWARRRGHEQLVSFLTSAGSVAETRPSGPEIPQRAVRLHAGSQDELLSAAISKSVALLQRSSDGFLRERGTCVSCHHQNQPTVALAWARDRGFAVDAKSVEAMVDVQRRSWSKRIEHAYQLDDPQPGGIEQIGYGLWGFGALGLEADETTRAMVWFLATQQFEDGRWVGDLMRPPSEGPDLLSTALAIRVLQLYPLAGREAEFRARVAKAAAWLQQTTPGTHQERALRLLALGWAGLTPEELAAPVAELLAEQRSDGGWAQLPELESDAYATGQSLVALRSAGGLATTAPAYQRGLEFLLSTQFDDGAWFVRSRSWAFQPPFESGFPFGKDQWISAPATAWATMALTLAARPIPGANVSQPTPTPHTEPSPRDPPPAVAAIDDSAAASTQQSVDFARDIKPLLERSCLACHSGEEPKGGFRVINRAALLEGGESEASALVAGKSDASVLLRLVSDKVAEREMPPLIHRDKFPALREDEIRLLRAWIDGGAAWPAEIKLQARETDSSYP